ncbi:MAG: calcium-binding protein [Solirubrobacteraceae bacterium]
MALAVSVGVAGSALANTSHQGWPKRTGKLRMNKNDSSRPLTGGRRNDELLGGHGNDTINGNGGRDVIWGDYKPSGQPTTQVDMLIGGPGADFIYGGHGTNYIAAGPGNDWIKTHWGRGIVDCGSGSDVLYISRRVQHSYKIRHCERVSHKTLGY